MIWRPSQRSRSSRKIVPEVQKWSGDPSEGPEVVGDPPGGPEVVGGHSRRFGCGRGTLLKVRNRSRDPTGGPEAVGGPSRRSGSGRWNVLEVRKRSVERSGGPEAVERFGSGR